MRAPGRRRWRRLRTRARSDPTYSEPPAAYAIDRFGLLGGTEALAAWDYGVVPQTLRKKLWTEARTLLALYRLANMAPRSKRENAMANDYDAMPLVISLGEAAREVLKPPIATVM